MENNIGTEIYDMHCHIYPNKIASKAVDSIGSFYGIKMFGDGTGDGLIREAEPCGIKKYLVCGAATTAEQVRAVNQFIAMEQKAHPEFYGFGTLHPDCENVEEEVENIISLGLHGIKLHPDFQNFCIDSPAADGIYSAASGRLPILFHMGDNRYDRTKPYRLLTVMKKFPKLTCIAAHLGGYSSWEDALALPDYLSNPRMYIDTSSSLAFLRDGKAEEIIRKHGTDRVFFGTDFPMWSAKEEVERFMSLKLTDDEREKILCGNAKEFIKNNQ